jgi:hypothetical protein
MFPHLALALTVASQLFQLLIGMLLMLLVGAMSAIVIGSPFV